LKFLGLSCDIILYLFFHKSFLLLLFCQIFVILTRIFLEYFSLKKFLLDLLQNHVCWQSTPQGPSEACGR
jgi:hypothetical protein